jgi:uncharacterized membrane protein
MDYFVLVLRLVHVIGGVVWVGAAFVMYAFIGPAISATQGAGQQVMRHLTTATRFTAAMTSAAFLTVIAGILLIVRDAGAGPAWMRSGPGIGFSLGGAFALIGLVTGMLVGMTTAALGRLGGGAQGAPPGDQAARMETLRRRLQWLNPLNTYVLLIATALMAIARYLVF